MTNQDTRLARLGDALEQAARTDLRPEPRRGRRRLAVAAVAAIAVLSGGAALASQLLGRDVSNSMLAGAAIFEARHPTCTEVVKDVEWHCVLDRPPVQEVQDFTGTKEETVDATKHVNGGCEGLDAAGLQWECYLGEAAVEHGIISEGSLGEVSLGPGHG